MHWLQTNITLFLAELVTCIQVAHQCMQTNLSLPPAGDRQRLACRCCAHRQPASLCGCNVDTICQGSNDQPGAIAEIFVPAVRIMLEHIGACHFYSRLAARSTTHTSHDSGCTKSHKLHKQQHVKLADKPAANKMCGLVLSQAVAYSLPIWEGGITDADSAIIDCGVPVRSELAHPLEAVRPTQTQAS